MRAKEVGHGRQVVFNLPSIPDRHPGILDAPVDSCLQCGSVQAPGGLLSVDLAGRPMREVNPLPVGPGIPSAIDFHVNAVEFNLHENAPHASP